ncbi:MAG TPA: gamma-glutamyltransferase [Solirubrobacteraceae bacterium]|nr:gamma-glutamyltransferase [Solirubrobacteraceae bacterium]
MDRPGPDALFSLSPARAASVAAEAMVASSQPLATLAGLDVLREGGSAVDAAICAAAVLCVTEPPMTGVGGDLFAIVRDGEGALHGLDAAGPAPRAAPAEPPAESGPRSVDVPGAVAGWSELSERFGRVGLDRCLTPAIEFARYGVSAGFNSAMVWQTSPRAPVAFGAAPDFGARYRLVALGDTLAGIASEGPRWFYTGPPARAIAEATWLSGDDLADYAPRWVEPLVGRYRGVDVAELPPPTQGVAALEALAILGDEEPALPELVRAVALALEDAIATVRDGADVSGLLAPEHVRARRSQLPARVSEPAGGTVCVCAVDRDGMAVSLLQSLYEAFGSGVVAGDSGIVLNNRAAGFAVQGTVVGGTRPYHTLIPGMLTRGRELVGPFGLMGGFIQAQSHVQFLCSLLPDGDPQVALDRGRFRIDGGTLSLEPPLWDHADELAALGFQIDLDAGRTVYGGGQAIIVRDGALFGGSDARKDGCALGF